MIRSMWNLGGISEPLQEHHRWNSELRYVCRTMQLRIEFHRCSRPSVLNCISCIGSSTVPMIHESARTKRQAR